MKKHTEEDLTGMGQFSWDRIVKQTELEKLGLPAETIAILRVYYSLAFNEGQAFLLDVLKDMYKNDADLLENLLESDVLH